MIRKLVGFVLEKEGFQVLSAENGVDAIHVSKLHPGEIDLLVSDVTMPGMDGPTLATELLSVDPDLPVLLMSGYHQDLPAYNQTRFRFLPKPFSIACLMRTVRSMMKLAAPSPAALKRHSG